MKNLIIASLIILFSSNCFAQDNQSKTNKLHKLSYEQYISHYGVDDTSIAIINVFFMKRENSAGGKMSFLPVSAGVTVIFPPLGLGLAAISTPLFVSGLITRNKYNKKKLLATLIDYQNENNLTVNLKKRVNTYFELEEEFLLEELAQTQFASLRAIR